MTSSIDDAHQRGQTLDRRRFLTRSAGLAAAWGVGGVSAGSLIAACGSSSTEVTQTSSVDDSAPYLQALFPTGDRQPAILAIGSRQRALVALTQGAGTLPTDAVPDTLSLTLTSPTGTETVIDAARHSDQIPDHYYPVEFTPERPGRWQLRTEVDGETSQIEFQVLPTAESPLVQIGEAMPAVDTPTVDDDRGVTPICTRTPEPCPFHNVSLTEALTQGKPVALMISTPGFCQTGICGPTLEILTGVAKDFPEVMVIHAEVYTDPQQLNRLPPSELVTETVNTFGMSFEPGLVVADASGTITDRLDIVMDATEMRAALTRAVG